MSTIRDIVGRARLSVVIATVAALGLLALVSRLAAARGSASEIWQILQDTWVLVLLLTIPYLAARALVWYSLLRELNIRVPLSHAAISFAGGEITKSLPAGVYVQNVLLARLEHFGKYSVVRSSMATTALLGLEAALALPVALIVGFPGHPWVRWMLIGVVAAWILLLCLAWMLVHHWAAQWGSGMPDWLERFRKLAEEFLLAGAELISRRVALNLLPVALYMLFYTLQLYAIVRAAGINTISFGDTLGIYALIVLAVILIPVPTEVGLTEAAGLGALVGFGVSSSKSAIVMLSLRILATGMTIAVSMVVLIAFRSQIIGHRVDELTAERLDVSPGS
jgi:uncharacterized membrane protein YbhN (UPF0104 family)